MSACVALTLDGGRILGPSLLEVAMALRCPRCRRVVSFRYVTLGLARWTTEVVPLGREDSYTRRTAEHTFPCVGRKIALKHILAEYVALVSPAAIDA